jgi:hypothetical protein
MLDFSESTYQWEFYSGGAKQLAKRIYTLDRVYEGDARIILNWMFYHDVLNKFSARHWGHRTSIMMGCAQDNYIIKAALQSGTASKVANSKPLYLSSSLTGHRL